MTVTLELPLPPRELSPNARVFWPVKAGAARGYRQVCWAIAYMSRCAHGPLSVPVKASITFTFPDKRRRDHDNALSSLKAGIDGIVDSGLIPGDDAERFRIVGVKFAVGKPAGVRIVLSSGGPTAVRRRTGSRSGRY